MGTAGFIESLFYADEPKGTYLITKVLYTRAREQGHDHFMAITVALNSHFAVRLRRPLDTLALALQTTPFMLLPESTGVELLAKYATFLEWGRVPEEHIENAFIEGYLCFMSLRGALVDNSEHGQHITDMLLLGCYLECEWTQVIDESTEQALRLRLKHEIAFTAKLPYTFGQLVRRGSDGRTARVVRSSHTEVTVVWTDSAMPSTFPTSDACLDLLSIDGVSGSAS